eukprot:1066700-Rhodomonas_salina.1
MSATSLRTRYAMPRADTRACVLQTGVSGTRPGIAACTGQHGKGMRMLFAISRANTAQALLTCERRRRLGGARCERKDGALDCNTMGACQGGAGSARSGGGS